MKKKHVLTIDINILLDKFLADKPKHLAELKRLDDEMKNYKINSRK
jgi:hypothetical protein